MKRTIYVILFLSLLLASCREDILKFENENRFVGSISIDSEPSGALIFLHDKNTEKKTPYKFVNLAPGNYSVTLKLNGYADTTIVKRVQASGNSIVDVSLSKK